MILGMTTSPKSSDYKSVQVIFMVHIIFTIYVSLDLVEVARVRTTETTEEVQVPAGDTPL